MSKIFLSIVLTLIAFPAFSECFDFVDDGPSAVGEVSFKGYTATKVCHFVGSNSTGSGQNDVLVFSDSEGALMQVTVKATTARCPGYCMGFEGLSGNAFGKNLTKSEVTSINLNISESGGWSYEDYIAKKVFKVKQSN